MSNYNNEIFNKETGTFWHSAFSASCLPKTFFFVVGSPFLIVKYVGLSAAELSLGFVVPV